MTIVMMLLMVQYTNGDVKAHKVFISKLSLYISTYCAGYMSNQMSLLHFRKTSASRTASDILALRACVLSFNEAKTTRLRPSRGQMFEN